MKYWLLTTEFPPFYGGGISTYCGQTCTMLSGAGNQVTVFLPHYESEKILITWEKEIRVIRFNPSISPTSKFLGYEANLSFVFAEEVIRVITEEGKPDVIESQEYLGIPYYLLQKKHLGYEALQGIKTVLTLHAPSFLYFDYNQVPLYKHPNFWTGEMERFCIRAADIAISPSAYLVEAIRSRMDLSGLDIQVLPNPFEPDYLDAPVPDFQKAEVLFYGKLIPQKGCIELLSYFKELWDEGLQIPLRLVGGGQHFFHPLEKDLGEHLKQKYKPYVDRKLLLVEGEITPQELATRLSGAQVIVIPSIVDNLPYTVLEAMALGKVVLASRQGGQSEVITHQVDGFLFDHREKGSFRENLLKIRALTKSAHLAIGEQAKEKIRTAYHPARILEKKITIIQQGGSTGTSSRFPLIRPPATVALPTFNTTNKVLTVVVPYFNMGQYIPDTIRSIKASTYRPIRILIVNDGSTDGGSIQTLKAYETDPQIRIIHKANAGLALARNTGAAEADSDFLAFLDPDDTVAPDYYRQAVRLLLEKENISFVGCWAQYFGESSDIWPTFNPEPPYVLLHNCMNTSAMIYKRVHFLDAGLNDARMIYGMEDYDSMLGMLAKGYRGVSFPEPWWNYRIRKDSMARGFTNDSKLFLYKLLAEKYRAFYGAYGSELFLLLNSNGPSLNIDNPTLNRGIYSKFAGSKIGQYLIRKVKKNKYLRPVVIRIYKKLVK